MTTSLWVVLGLIVWIFVGGGTRLDLAKFLFLGPFYVMDFLFPRSPPKPTPEMLERISLVLRKSREKPKAGEIFTAGDVANHDQIIEKMLSVPTIEEKLQILSSSDLFNLDTMQNHSDFITQRDAFMARLEQERVMYRYVPKPPAAPGQVDGDG